VDDIAVAQAQLGKAINRARAGEDRALAGRVRDEGERLVKLLYGALGMAKLHALTNRAFDQPIADITRALGVLLDLLGAVHLLAVEEQVYMNDIRIRLEGGDIGDDFGKKLREHGIGGLSFHGPLTETQFRGLVAILAREPDPAARAGLQAALREAGIDSLDLAGIHHFRLAGEAGGHTAVDAATMSERGAALLDEVFENLAGSRQPNPLPTRRLVTGLLDAGAATQWVVVEPEDVSPYAAHNLRVCNLVLLLGNALGLTPGVLQDLGVAAMFHDAGYALCSASPEQQIEGERAFDLHPLLAVRVLLRQRGFHEAKIRRVMTALDHHRRYDDSRGVPSLFGRIVAIAEDYDTLTQPRSGGLSPRRALSLMAAAAGGVYDPVLLPLFVNLMGAYPRQTRVRLSDGRVGRVVSLPRAKESFARPVVRVERLADGRTAPDETDVDLAWEAGLRIESVFDEGASTSIEPDLATLKVVNEARRAAARVGANRAMPASLSQVPPPATAPRTTLPSAAAKPLSEGALPGVLRDLYLGNKSGTLHLRRQAKHLSLLIWEGNALHASSTAPEDHLGAVAVREGLMSQTDLDRANEAPAGQGKRLGFVLREMGIMDDAQVGDALTVHAREVILKALSWTEGSYSFEEHALSPELIANPPLRLSTPDLILEAVRRLTDPDVVRYHLGDVDRVARLSAHPRVKAMSVGLAPLDGYTLSRIDGQTTLRELMRLVPGERLAVMQSLFGLLCVGLIELLPPASSPRRSGQPG